ncbi:uncharacterized protein LOC110462361 [Mizuhopecten yessoensis]|uniref:Uncharacterized protein n=1 Tax=Mizuhopecten yessoensis TaxID=6573 RepID=A0A210PYD6_MIZYE|nr:uncharacterized protein LOC110462361 [Mizuhopecten yessoensis]OWF41492.1 hypothetical protein KP79_PYT17381 [Mizuhopecten yessoensis]
MELIDYIYPKLFYRRMLLVLVGILGYFSCSNCDASAINGPWRRIGARRVNPPYATPSAPMPDFDFMLSHSMPMLCPSTSIGIPRKMTLTDAQMLELLHANGGSFNPSVMAAARAAADQFPNLIPLTQYTEDDQIDRTFDFDPVTDNEIAKQTLIEDLNKWSSLKQQVVNGTLPRATVSSMHSTTQSVEQGGSPTTPDVFGSVNQDSMSSTNDHQQESAIVDQKLKSKLEQLHKQIELLLQGNSIRSEGVMGLMNSFNISTHPRILQGLDPGSRLGPQRVIRSTDGSTSVIQYCRQKGNATADGFLHMCDECAATTTLASDKFPPYLNEIVCGTSDRTCLTVRGTPHGACKQSFIYVNMLRRRPGGCRIMIQNGQQVLVDAWEVYTQKIRSGCECFINRQSLFAKYIGPLG